MTDLQVNQSTVSGNIKVPPSKSFSHRALIISALADGRSTISNLLLADDTLVTLTALQKLGVKISLKGKTATIIGTDGKIEPLTINTTLDMHSSGTSARLLAGVCALSNKPAILTGSPRLQERPMADLLNVLIQLGTKINYLGKQGFLPIRIQGPTLHGGTVHISGKASSQFISSLLLVGPYMDHPLKLIVKDELVSKPYVDITTSCMKSFSASSSGRKNQPYTARNYTIEGDYSSASYFLAAGVLTGTKLAVSGLNKNSVQADKKIIDIIKGMLGNIKVSKDNITVTKSRLRGITVNMNDCPDIVPTVAILAAFAEGTTTITRISHLRTKETDRIKALQTELNKMSVKVSSTTDSLTITGGHPQGATINTYEDHRIAMAFTIATLKARGKSIIKNYQVANKSYPTFYPDLKKLGTKISYLK